MNKKLGLGVVLLLAVAFTACGQQYDNASDFRVTPLDGGRSAEITAYVGNKQTVNIPPRIEGMTITKIGDGAFEGKEIIRITIPNSVTSIGRGAFTENRFTSITLPAGLTSIGAGAFNSCTSLTSITLPAGLTSIGEYAFGYCTSLASVTISAGLTSIGSAMFFDCTSLTSITIPASVTSIGGRAFDGTAWLDSQPDGLVYVNKVLYKYKGTIPANTVINNIRTDTIAIAGSAFWECYGLASVTLAEGVTTIGNHAFGGCTSLASITIPASVTSIGELAFRDWSSRQTIYIRGKANQEAADAAWDRNWRNDCKAQIVYQP